MSCRLAALLALTLLTACATPLPAPAPDPQPTQEPAAKEATVEKPKTPQPTITYDETTPAGARMQWVIAAINERGGEVSEEEISEQVHPLMLAQLPAEQLKQVFVQVSSQLGPLRPVELAQQSPSNLVLRMDTKPGIPLNVVVNVSSESPHQIDGLLFQPAQPKLAELPAEWPAIEKALSAAASSTQLYVARIDPATQTCSPVHTLSPKKRMALGSTFKLYILAELAAQIAAGTHTWQQELAIVEQTKSLPSGVMQAEPAGKKFSLEHFATQMISISDNTATDHLLKFVGREKVEARVASSGHGQPGLMRPFLSTREMFTLKLARDEAARDAYVSSDEPARRAALQKIDAEALPALESAMGWDKPRHIDTIEWFASGEDLCMLHAQLVARRDEPAVAKALEIMARNDGGVGVDKERWTYAGFKGGSEPGVGHLSYLLERADGAWFSITVAGNDTENPVEIGTLMQSVRAATRILVF